VASQERDLRLDSGHSCIFMLFVYLWLNQVDSVYKLQGFLMKVKGLLKMNFIKIILYFSTLIIHLLVIQYIP